jgi:hypothetical protein
MVGCLSLFLGGVRAFKDAATLLSCSAAIAHLASQRAEQPTPNARITLLSATLAVWALALTVRWRANVSGRSVVNDRVHRSIPLRAYFNRNPVLVIWERRHFTAAVEHREPAAEVAGCSCCHAAKVVLDAAHDVEGVRACSGPGNVDRRTAGKRGQGERVGRDLNGVISAAGRQYPVP